MAARKAVTGKPRPTDQYEISMLKEIINHLDNLPTNLGFVVGTSVTLHDIEEQQVVGTLTYDSDEYWNFVPATV